MEREALAVCIEESVRFSPIDKLYGEGLVVLSFEEQIGGGFGCKYGREMAEAVRMAFQVCDCFVGEESIRGGNQQRERTRNLGLGDDHYGMIWRLGFMFHCSG